MIIGIDASRANAAEKTGTEWYSWHLIRGLVGLAGEHQIRLYTREPLRDGLNNLGPMVEERVLRWRPGVLWSHVRLSWELWRRPPDILFVPADTVPLIHPKKTITTIHDVAFERWPELYQGKSVQRQMGWLRPIVHLAVRVFTLGRYSASERDYHRWSVRHALRSSQVILTVSNFSKQEIVETLRVTGERIIVTPLGVRQSTEVNDITADTINKTQRRYRLERPYILFIGRLEEKKNIRLLIDSYLLYRKTVANPVDLVLVGAPGFGWETTAAMIPADVWPFIHQLGWVTEDDRWRLHAGAKALVFLSAYEGFGLPPLESLTLGVPVLASQLGSLPEVLGDSAFFVPLLNPVAVAPAIHRITTDDQLRQRLISSGHERVRQYTWPATSKATWEAFCRVEPGLARTG